VQPDKQVNNRIANHANYAKIALLPHFAPEGSTGVVRCYEKNRNSKIKRRRRQNYDRPKFRAATGWADLIGAKLLGANLQEAKYDKDTKCPDGFDPVAAGAIKV
jgi:23S rRNA maturation mini-RNase III